VHSPRVSANVCKVVGDEGGLVVEGGPGTGAGGSLGVGIGFSVEVFVWTVAVRFGEIAMSLAGKSRMEAMFITEIGVIEIRVRRTGDPVFR